ncbi:uncharacterized protein PITG_06230 [Phytophthora infestans T30-4]|uniref:Uncharacterized protein n=1 Tax=Phytophthora infestans (strain T30-4) TaxID=403677 RepID=D0N4D5_PHYIT|nr:uncharacterized protein PITG_06230 [Phytophthora infestans T30-4]EEY69743.1 hypothetical protein PITG_06230 [Phytophthora infestans T30-4]|eukprot:XP_002998390.1 hypothetical protein PITG_06230 [Phytophthora infestans T30-4]
MSHKAPQEKLLIIRTHQYFLAEAQQRLDPLGQAVRKRIATCLAGSASTVARVVVLWDASGDDAFTEPPAKRGCPPRSVGATFHGYITDMVHNESTVRRALGRIELSYVRGRKRDPRADTEANHAYILE